VAATLAQTRTALATALDALSDDAQVYRRNQANYQYPAVLIGWPQSLDFRPTMGGPRDYVIDVYVAVEVGDDDSSDDLLSELMESAVAILLANDSWDVQPATDFAEQLLADNRVTLSCRLPVAVYA
jgi:hypothetical protein